MPGPVIGKSMNLGFPGTYDRNADCYIAARLVYDEDVNGPDFGEPMILNADNTVSSVKDYLLTSGNTFLATKFAGVAVREVKTIQTYEVGSLNAAKYQPGDPCDVLERGNVSVVCQNGTPVAGGAVYVRTVARTGLVVGGFEYGTDTDSTTRILLTNAQWMTGEKDANNVCELAILSRNKA